MKKITKNNKGFSLIELIIVIAIMAVLVAIIAPNLTKYLGSSKQKTDQKNADELASQIQTSITDYETSNGALGACSITWSGSTASSGNTAFDTILNDTITTSAVSKETGAPASATIATKASGSGYTITVTLGNATATK